MLAQTTHRLASEVLTEVSRVPQPWLGPDHPSAVIQRSVDVLRTLVDGLSLLRRLSSDLRPHARSSAFAGFFDRLLAQVDEPYLQNLRSHLGLLSFERGVHLDVRLGPAATLTQTRLLRPGPPARFQPTRLIKAGRQSLSILSVCRKKPD